MSVGTRMIRNVESKEWNWLRRFAVEQEQPMGVILSRWIAEKRAEIDAEKGGQS